MLRPKSVNGLAALASRQFCSRGSEDAMGSLYLPLEGKEQVSKFQLKALGRMTFA